MPIHSPLWITLANPDQMKKKPNSARPTSTSIGRKDVWYLNSKARLIPGTVIVYVLSFAAGILLIRSSAIGVASREFRWVEGSTLTMPGLVR